MRIPTHRRIRRILSGVIVGTGLSLGAAGAATAETVLRIVPQADLKNIDPVWTTAAITANHGYMVYDMLFAMDSNLEPQPQMVDSYDVSDDGLTYTFTLREGLLFHDGSPVEASDAVASIKRWAAKRSDGLAMMERADSLEATDARTFVLKLDEKFGPTIQVLANPTLPLVVMREEEAMTDPNEQVAEVIGSGPFVFAKDEWVPGNKVVYRRFDDYVPRSEPSDGFAGGKVVKVDRVEWIYIPDTNTATQALIAGEVDAYEIPPIDLLPVLEADPDITVKVLDRLGKMGHIRPNHRWPPFDNVKARQALQLLVDQTAFLAAQVGNPSLEKVCYAVFMCDSPFSTDAHSEPWRTQDKEKAKQLLAEGGYNGEPIVVLVPTDQQIIYNNVLVMIDLLKEIGVDVVAQSMDWSTLTLAPAEDRGSQHAAQRRLAHLPDLVDRLQHVEPAHQPAPGGDRRREVGLVRLAQGRHDRGAARRFHRGRHQGGAVEDHRRPPEALLRGDPVPQHRAVRDPGGVAQLAEGCSGGAVAGRLEHREEQLSVDRDARTAAGTRWPRSILRGTS